MEPHSIRCTDAERQQTAQSLSQAMSRGQLSFEEFEERTDACFAATTRGDLEKLLEDLGATDGSPLTPVGDRTPAQLASSRALAHVGGAPTTNGFSLALFGGTEVANVTVPASNNALALFGGTGIDLRSCRFSEKLTEINALAAFGGIDILVPEGVRVIVDGHGIFGGFESNLKKGALNPTQLPADAPTVRVKGLALFGGVSVTIFPMSDGDPHDSHTLRPH